MGSNVRVWYHTDTVKSDYLFLIIQTQTLQKYIIYFMFKLNNFTNSFPSFSLTTEALHQET
jgi:hypothetical protein